MPKKRLPKAKVIQAKIQGKPVRQIAAELGISPSSVQKISNSNECKIAMHRAQMKIMELGDLAIDTFRLALEDRHNNLPLAVRVAEPILKTMAALKEKQEIAFEFPRPTVIKRIDGTVVEIGVPIDEHGSSTSS